MDDISEKQLKWNGHLQRMNEGKIQLRVWNWIPAQEINKEGHERNGSPASYLKWKTEDFVMDTVMIKNYGTRDAKCANKLQKSPKKEKKFTKLGMS